MGRTIVGLVVLWSLCAGCQWSSNSSSGLTSVIRVQGGQAMRGSIAGPPDNNLATVTPFPKNSTIFPGEVNKSINGKVGPDANAVALGVAGDDAYWLVPALNPEHDDPHSFDYNASLSLSPALASSPLLQTDPNDPSTILLPLSLRAVDAAGNFGSAAVYMLYMEPQGLDGTLVVSLDWDAPVDLDLHVQTPILATNDAGLVTVWAKARSAEPNLPDGGGSDGVLDLDSNEDCQIDGRDRENVVWTGQPPSGHYIVRVDAFSLCGQTSAAWHAIAFTPQGTLGEASGVLTDAATREAPTAGAGLTAFEFDYP
ncbi:MAG: hypothetical protein WCG85_01630 [Polyangia bacterium]